MKAISTQNRKVKTNNISFRRALVLIIVCTFLPGCIGHTPKCEMQNTGLCLQKPPLTLFINTTTEANDAESRLNESSTELTVAINDNSPAKNTQTGANTTNTLPANDAQSTLVNPISSLNDEHHIDPHNHNEKEKVISISLPRLMRIAILMLLLVIIV